MRDGDQEGVVIVIQVYPHVIISVLLGTSKNIYGVVVRPTDADNPRNHLSRRPDGVARSMLWRVSTASSATCVQASASATEYELAHSARCRE